MFYIRFRPSSTELVVILGRVRQSSSTSGRTEAYEIPPVVAVRRGRLCTARRAPRFLGAVVLAFPRSAISLARNFAICVINLTGTGLEIGRRSVLFLIS